MDMQDGMTSAEPRRFDQNPSRTLTPSSQRGRSALWMASLLLGVTLFVLLWPQQAWPQSTTGIKRSSSAIAITADGATLLVVNPDSNSLSLVNLGTPATVTEVPVGVDPRSVVVSPDGTVAYVANQVSDNLSVVDLTTQSVTVEVAVGDRPVGVAVSPNGRLVAVAELGDDQVRFLDTADLSTLSIIPVADRPHSLSFTPDGHRLLVTHLLSGQVSVISLAHHTIYLPLILKSSPEVRDRGLEITAGTHQSPISLPDIMGLKAKH